MSSDSSERICVDLFCGAGGLSKGLQMAGFHSVVAVDFDKNATATYKQNHPDTVVMTKDICSLDPKEILDILGGRELDLLAGGPSCQGFSTHGKRDSDDPRNFLFEHYLRIAQALRPKWIVIENVQGMLTYNKGYFRDEILSKLTAMGYHADAKVLCAADYGIPQLRRRIFFMATRTNSEITFPPPTHSATGIGKLKPYVTVGEALFDLPPVSFSDEIQPTYTAQPRTNFQKYLRKGSKALTMHIARPLSAQAASIAKHVVEGYGLRSVPHEALPDRFKKMRTISTGELRKDCTTLYHRLSRTRPSYTITCNFKNIASGPFLHPLEDRSLSYREAARLMTFPDSYEFVGVGIPRQIGNAVPPLLAKAVGEHIQELLSIQEAATFSRTEKSKRGMTQVCQATYA
jgi:DNA (cytosine-5)-methyltransferase 1